MLHDDDEDGDQHINSRQNIGECPEDIGLNVIEHNTWDHIIDHVLCSITLRPMSSGHSPMFCRRFMC